jgi:hypothetical protein
MTDERTLLEQEALGFAPPSGSVEGVWRRAERRRRRRRLSAGVTALVVAVLGVGLVLHALSPGATRVPASPTPSRAPIGTFAQVRGWITYRSGGQILAIDPADPTDAVAIAEAEECWQAAHIPRTCGVPDPVGWSRDGTKLLVSGPIGSDGSAALFLLSADGSATRIVKGGPTWGSLSPDGTRLTYSLGGGEPGPVIEDAAGGEPRSLVPGCRGCGEGLPESAAWSPDGSRIAWIDFWEDSPKYGHHAYSLSFVNVDGTGLQEQVVHIGGGDGSPQTGPPYDPASYGLVWSPDGSELAFWQTPPSMDSYVPGQGFLGEIFVINADGSGLRQITDNGDNRWPAWSPDGSRIALVHDGELFTMAPDGTDMQPVSGIHPQGPIAWNWG